MNQVDAPLAIDIPCARCTYNLRTKRPSEICPECGLPVAPSLEAHRKNNQPLYNSRRAAAGAWLLVFAALSTKLWLVVAILSIGGGLGFNWHFGLTSTALHLFWPMELLQIAAALAALLGVYLLATGIAPLALPDSPPSPLRSLLRFLFLALTPLAALATKLATTVPLTGVRRWMWLDVILPPLAITATGAAMFLYLIGGWHLFRLARRQRWKILASFTALLFPIAALIQTAPGTTVAIWWHIFPNWPFGTPLLEAYQSIRPSIDNGGPLLTTALAIYFTLLALRLRKYSHTSHPRRTKRSRRTEPRKPAASRPRFTFRRRCRCPGE